LICCVRSNATADDISTVRLLLLVPVRCVKSFMMFSFCKEERDKSDTAQAYKQRRTQKRRRTASTRENDGVERCTEWALSIPVSLAKDEEDTHTLTRDTTRVVGTVIGGRAEIGQTK
jgi:hypothetical protein